MCRTLVGLMAITVCVGVGQSALAQQIVTQHSGKVVMEEADWSVLADEPAKQLTTAKENFLQQDYQAAATALRKAASYIAGAASVATGDAKTALHDSAKELRVLALDLKIGTATTVQALDGALGRAAHALAAHHTKKAKESMARQAYEATGHYLQAAGTELEQGAKWMGHELEAGTMATVRASRKLKGKLAEGTGFVVDETGKAIGFVGTEVEKLGRWIKPRQPGTAKK